MEGPRAAREGARRFSVADVVSLYLEIKPRSRPVVSLFWIRCWPESFVRRAHMYLAEVRQNTIAYHAQSIAA